MNITDYLLGYSPPVWATLIAGVFVVISLSLSMYLIFEHLSSYKNPEEQKFLIGVVLMVPCYAVESVSLANLDYFSSLYHWCIHQLVLIVRYYVIAMNHLRCIALEDTSLVAWTFQHFALSFQPLLVLLKQGPGCDFQPLPLALATNSGSTLRAKNVH
ncbi:hypothetical protein V6N12_006464 [Hibiscus sabdariffa]|uniref:Uncharacterized protein n=1 Tax=Hibiscus sabdariffa TaxID=183260 RepID=A0ABR2EYX7_9ROSI